MGGGVKACAANADAREGVQNKGKLADVILEQSLILNTVSCLIEHSNTFQIPLGIIILQSDLLVILESEMKIDFVFDKNRHCTDNFCFFCGAALHL